MKKVLPAKAEKKTVDDRQELLMKITDQEIKIQELTAEVEAAVAVRDEVSNALRDSEDRAKELAAKVAVLEYEAQNNNKAILRNTLQTIRAEYASGTWRDSTGRTLSELMDSSFI